MMIKALIIGIGVVSILGVCGCDSNPTNEPSAADIAKANAHRAEAVDNDPTMTPEQKAKIKEMMHVGSQGRTAGK